MITILEALDWLNQFDRSHLNVTNQQLVAIAKNNRTVIDCARDILCATLRQAKASPHDALDYPETLLNCAAIESDRGLKEQAIDHVREATKCYHDGKDSHGKAVALWMSGIIELSVPNVDACFQNWKDAIDLLDELQHQHRHTPDTQNWYNGILHKMNQDLITLPLESFFWLNEFTPSRLSPSNQQLIKALDQSVRNREFGPAYQRIAILKDIAKDCPDPLETAEIFAEIGRSTYQMDNLLEAIKDLKSAVIKYHTGSHQQAVIRWILGAIQWLCKDERISAKENWERSLLGFCELCQKTDHQNLKSQKAWYEEKIENMKEALSGKISEHL